MTTTTALAFSDQVRREAYLLRLSWFVQDLRRHERRAIYSDLRSGLAEASARQGMPAALRDLGPARALGAGYVDAAGRRLPRWMSGVLALAVVLYAYVLAMLSYWSGAIDAAEQIAPDERTTVAGQWLATDLEVVSGPDSLSFAGNIDVLLAVVLVLVFFVFARGWRLWTGRGRSGV